jgi:hypothetical protein
MSSLKVAVTVLLRATEVAESTGAVLLTVGTVVSVGAVVPPPPPHALSVSKNTTVNKVCLLNKYMDYPHYLWF